MPTIRRMAPLCLVVLIGAIACAGPYGDEKKADQKQADKKNAARKHKGVASVNTKEDSLSNISLVVEEGDYWEEIKESDYDKITIEGKDSDYKYKWKAVYVLQEPKDVAQKNKIHLVIKFLSRTKMTALEKEERENSKTLDQKNRVSKGKSTGDMTVTLPVAPPNQVPIYPAEFVSIPP